MIGFKLDQREDFASFATSREFATNVVYYPKKGGPSRALRAFVEPDSNTMLADDRLNQQKSMEITIAKDEAGLVLLDNGQASVHGGILRPERGDAFWIRGFGDPETCRYVFTGFVIEDKPHSWTLQCRTEKVRRTGNISVINPP